MHRRGHCVGEVGDDDLAAGGVGGGRAQRRRRRHGGVFGGAPPGWGGGRVVGSDDPRPSCVGVRSSSETAQYRRPTVHPTKATSATRSPGIKRGSWKASRTVAIGLSSAKSIQSQKTTRAILDAGRLNRYNSNARRTVSRLCV